MGLYNPDGSLIITVVDGTQIVGRQAPDGSINAVVDDINGYGVNHKSGALRVTLGQRFVRPHTEITVSHTAVMANPPTITSSTNISLLSGLSTVSSWTPESSSLIRCFGGASDVQSYRRINSANSTGSTYIRTVPWRAEAQIDAAKVGVQLLGRTSQYRFLVDDVYVKLTPETPPATSGITYYLLDFTSAGGKASRKIAVEAINDLGFYSFYTDPADTISRTPDTNLIRAIFAGDSFLDGSTGASLVNDGVGLVLPDLLGIRDAWISGVTGTGYVNDVSGTKNTLPARITDVTRADADVVFLLMGINDIGWNTTTLTNNVNSCIASIRAAKPTALIILVGPYDRLAPDAPVNGFTACRDAIKATENRANGIYFIDMEGVAYTKADVLHPDSAGHATLAKYIASQIRQLL